MAIIDTLACINLEGESDSDLRVLEKALRLQADICRNLRHARCSRLRGAICEALRQEAQIETQYAALPENLRW